MMTAFRDTKEDIIEILQDWQEKYLLLSIRIPYKYNTV